MNTLKINSGGRKKLLKIINKPTGAGAEILRARVVLLSANGHSGREIAETLSISREAVSRIRKRFIEGGFQALPSVKQSGRRLSIKTPENEKRVADVALSPPPPGRSRWTVRLLAKHLKLSTSSVTLILRNIGLKPHLHRTYKVSLDPDFASRVIDVVGLYLNPPQNSVVLSLDEKTQIQALERTQMPLPMRAGRAATHTHDYKRHGVVDLYAALEVANGKVTHELTKSHTSKDFIHFMEKVVREHPEKQLHVILDNSSSHKSELVGEWMKKHPRVHFHFTPTSASWLNQVEGFFGILGKQSLSHASFTATKKLCEHISNYIAGWNKLPTPFLWTKPALAIIKTHKKMIDQISKTVH